MIRVLGASSVASLVTSVEEADEQIKALPKVQMARIRAHVERTLRLRLLFDAVGIYFNEQGNLEHTCSSSTLASLDNLLGKLRWLEHPPHLKRYVVTGVDGRGHDILRFLDGTNFCETTNDRLEKPLGTTNGGFKEKTFDGKVLGKVSSAAALPPSSVLRPHPILPLLAGEPSE